MNILDALLARGVPKSLTRVEQPKTIWELADRAAREMTTWPAWKIRAADRPIDLSRTRSRRCEVL
jgi:hypothetical protein